MASLNQIIELSSLPESSYEALPEGWYTATIVKSELKATKTGGEGISLKFNITGPTHQGRNVFTMINIRNISQKAEEIGRETLGNLMRAIGLDKLSDTDQLLSANLSIKLIQTKSYADESVLVNEVKAYKALQGSALNIPKAEDVKASLWAKR